MNALIARDSRAPSPSSTEKRAPDIRVARSKSTIPSPVPISECASTGKSKVRGVPHVLEQIEAQLGPAESFFRQRDSRRFQVRAAGVDVGSVAQTKLEVDGRRDSHDLGDLVVTDKASDVVRNLDVDIERHRRGRTNGG